MVFPRLSSQKAETKTRIVSWILWRISSLIFGFGSRMKAPELYGIGLLLAHLRGSPALLFVSFEGILAASFSQVFGPRARSAECAPFQSHLRKFRGFWKAFLRAKTGDHHFCGTFVMFGRKGGVLTRLLRIAYDSLFGKEWLFGGSKSPRLFSYPSFLSHQTCCKCPERFSSAILAYLRLRSSLLLAGRRSGLRLKAHLCGLWIAPRGLLYPIVTLEVIACL